MKRPIIKTKKAHSEEEGHLMISLNLSTRFQASRSLCSKLWRKWRWTALLSCQKVKNSKFKKLTKIPTYQTPPKPTQITTSSRKELLMRPQMLWEITITTVKQQGRSKRRISLTSRRDKNSTKLSKWRGRLRCVKTSFTLVSANSEATALMPTPRTSSWRRSMFKAITWPNSALNFTITRLAFATTVKDANSCTLFTIEERKLDSCKDCTKVLDWPCWELSKSATHKELISCGLTLSKVTDAEPQNQDSRYLKASTTKSNGKFSNKRTNKLEFWPKSKTHIRNKIAWESAKLTCSQRANNFSQNKANSKTKIFL